MAKRLVYTEKSGSPILPPPIDIIIKEVIIEKLDP